MEKNFLSTFIHRPSIILHVTTFLISADVFYRLPTQGDINTRSMFSNMSKRHKSSTKYINLIL